MEFVIKSPADVAVSRSGWKIQFLCQMEAITIVVRENLTGFFKRSSPLLLNYHLKSDWSLVYVVIITVLIIALLISSIWSLIYLCRKGDLPCKKFCPRKRRRLHRYSPLADPEIMRMSTKSKLNFAILIPSN